MLAFFLFFLIYSFIADNIFHLNVICLFSALSRRVCALRISIIISLVLIQGGGVAGGVGFGGVVEGPGWGSGGRGEVVDVLFLQWTRNY